MRRAPWFWGTLAFWLLVGGVGLSRALLWGPSKMPRHALASFEGTVNGSRVHAETWSAEGGVVEAADSLGDEWAGEGFHPLAEDQDLLALAIGAAPMDPEAAEVLRRCVQVLVFERRGDYRVLGLIRNHGSHDLSGITLDLPGAALRNASPSGLPDAPGPVPETAVSDTLGCGPFRLVRWRFRAAPPSLEAWCREHAVALTPQAAGSGCFTARRLSRRWWLELQRDPSGIAWVWVTLPEGGLER